MHRKREQLSDLLEVVAEKTIKESILNTQAQKNEGQVKMLVASLAIQWLRPCVANAGGMGLPFHWGTRSHML